MNQGKIKWKQNVSFNEDIKVRILPQLKKINYQYRVRLPKENTIVKKNNNKKIRQSLKELKSSQTESILEHTKKDEKSVILKMRE